MNNIMYYKHHCCGCGLCKEICPHSAIYMKENYQGFLYPEVNKQRCVNCGLCLKRCIFNNKNVSLNSVKSVFAAKHKNIETRMLSRSGGAFSAIADNILNDNGIVYGCKLFNYMVAKHVRIDTIDNLDELRGSKYIQSDISEVYRQIKEDLKKELKIVFVGTACQVAALNSYIQDENKDNIILIDIICHGVGSPKLWAEYLNSLEKLKTKKIVKVSFRNKVDFGWHANVESIYFEDERYDSEVFKKLYVSHLALRTDCSACPYKRRERIGDITLGDCWGIMDVRPEFDDNKGVSLILINTEKGMNLFKRISDLVYIAINDNKVLEQSPLNHNWKLPKKYHLFWKYYDCYGFTRTIDKYNSYAESIMFSDEPRSFVERIWYKCINILNKKK